MRRPLRDQIVKTTAGVAAVGVLGAVFLLYMQPAFMVTMIDQVWACF